MNKHDVLRIELWDDPRLRRFGAALEGDGIEVSFCSREEAETRLRAGLSDLAVLPSDRVLADLEVFDVLPAVAYSSWSTPHVSLSMRDGLAGGAELLECDDPGALESLVARIVLKEHYGAVARVETLAGAATDSDASAVLAIDQEPPTGTSACVLDLGQEWYELTNYPMVWGLFVVRKGEVSGSTVRLLREAAEALETSDHLDGTDPEEAGFSLPRFRFDSIAVASLTELCDYLYYYGITTDVPELKVAHLPENEDTSDDMRNPLL